MQPVAEFRSFLHMEIQNIKLKLIGSFFLFFFLDTLHIFLLALCHVWLNYNSIFIFEQFVKPPGEGAIKLNSTKTEAVLVLLCNPVYK